MLGSISDTDDRCPSSHHLTDPKICCDARSFHCTFVVRRSHLGNGIHRRGLDKHDALRHATTQRMSPKPRAGTITHVGPPVVPGLSSGTRFACCC